MTTGERAFQRASTIETLNAILKEEVPELPETVPAGLRQIITHCLEKEPERRFQTASDVAFALRSFASTTTTALPLAAERPGRRPRTMRAHCRRARGRRALLDRRILRGAHDHGTGAWTRARWSLCRLPWKQMRNRVRRSHPTGGRSRTSVTRGHRRRADCRQERQCVGASRRPPRTP